MKFSSPFLFFGNVMYAPDDGTSGGTTTEDSGTQAPVAESSNSQAPAPEEGVELEPGATPVDESEKPADEEEALTGTADADAEKPADGKTEGE